SKDRGLGGQAQWSWPPRPRCLYLGITSVRPEDREDAGTVTWRWPVENRKYPDNCNSTMQDVFPQSKFMQHGTHYPAYHCTSEPGKGHTAIYENTDLPTHELRAGL
ncbi:MAG: hypothetical protein K2J00_06235, partial [Bacteroidaceae bacterium]|nr:hypothetical protein [Bacteroidaceae bacterium]